MTKKTIQSILQIIALAGVFISASMVSHSLNVTRELKRFLGDNPQDEFVARALESVGTMSVTSASIPLIWSVLLLIIAPLFAKLIHNWKEVA